MLIAKGAAKGEIFAGCSAAMLSGEDVVDDKAQSRIRLGQMTILADVTRAPANKFIPPFFHIKRRWLIG